MMQFTKVDKAGHDGHNLGFRLIANDGKAYEFAITPDCFVNLFAMGWKAAANLPHVDARQGTAPTIQAQASFAVADMKPMFALMSGPLSLLLPLDGEEMAYLHNQMQDFLNETKGNHSH
jgi:hypothetical protein